MIRKLAFNKKGTRIATRDEKGIVKIWNAETSQKTCEIKEHEKTVTDFSFSPDGKRIATVAEDNKGKIWDSESCKEKSTLTISLDDPISKLAFSPDGNRIITLTDWMIGVWDVNNGKPIRLGPSGHTDRVTDLAFSSNGHYFASASYNGKVKVWDTDTAQELYTLTGHGGKLNALAFSPDVQYLATASDEGMLEAYEFLPREVVTLAGNKGSFWDVAYSPDGKRIATAGNDGNVSLWDAGEVGRQ